eukprot:8088381-Pyramimonas_sp.AAC.1
MAKLLLLGPLPRAKAERPQLYIRSVVDDIALQACGRPAQVAGTLAGGFESLLVDFGRLKLPVAMKKT